MNVRDFLKNNIVILDGGMGTLLQKAGLMPGELTESWNITHPDVVTGAHKAYFDAGTNIICTNTFGANILKFPDNLEEIISAAVSCAKAARDASDGTQTKLISLDVGPTGKLLAPFGDLDFEDAVSIFAKTVEIGAKCGVDLVTIETMNDSYETKAALLAVRETCDLPVIVTNAYGEDGKLMTGATPSAMAAMLEGMGADAIGANCSLGPKQLFPVIEELLDVTNVPVVLKPNAGLPKSVDGKTVYDVDEDEFSDEVLALVKKGVSVVGGCCGTTPDYIAALSKKVAGMTPVLREKKNFTVVSSNSKTVFFGKDPVLIGERINPTGKKLLKEALRAGDMNYILGEAINEEEKGCHVLDVNVGLPEIDEVAMLRRAVCEIQAVTTLPLQIDTSDKDAMEAALRRYNGKAMINSVNGKAESMEAVFPLQKKYGGVIVCLTLDDNGIPSSVEGRVEIAERIVKEAEKYGIDRKDLIFDTLAMTVSADGGAALVTLGALEEIRKRTGCCTSLGVSNVSFGLPDRPCVDSSFFVSALERGLCAAIMNPNSEAMMRSYYSYRVLHGLDENCADYIGFASRNAETTAPKKAAVDDVPDLKRAVIKGLREKAGEITEKLLETRSPLDLIENEIIPALDEVGRGFEKKTVYLPNLLMSAEAAKESFAKVKAAMPEGEGTRCHFVIATVKGDIHDIGKNIVRLLLENYGFAVTDLGRDVEPETVVEAVISTKAPICGLSALMTTTVPAMEETVKLLRERVPECKIVVGGAVLTEEYAEKIGADKYSPDAMATVRYAEMVDSQLKK